MPEKAVLGIPVRFGQAGAVGLSKSVLVSNAPVKSTLASGSCVSRQRCAGIWFRFVLCGSANSLRFER